MGLASSPSRHPKTAPPTAKQECKKTPKQRLRHVNTDPIAVVAAKKRRNQLKQLKPQGLDTQPGAHQHLPIEIDSDDGTESGASLNKTPKAAVRYVSFHTTHLPRLHTDNQSAYSLPVSPASRTTPSRNGAPAAKPSLRCDIRAESSNLASPYLQHERTASYADDGIDLTQAEIADDSIDLTLADIADFHLRQTTAQLMMVAPGLPVADLYRLLIDRRGHFEAAKQDVIRQSQQPYASVSPQRPLAPSRAATVTQTTHDIVPVIGDEPFIKLDFDDPDFMWDNAASEEPRKQKRPSRARAGKFAKGSGSKGKLSKRLSSKGKGKSAGDVNRGMRETSYDRSFVVPDEEVLPDSDETYSDDTDPVSDQADVDMTDDGTNLTIDMKPRYSYNSDLLASPVSKK